MNNKTLILGDPHLGAQSVSGKPVIGNQLNSRVIDQFKILDFVFNYTVDNDIDTIIITGDLFDVPTPSSSIIVLLIEWLRKCSDTGISVHILLGNHDLLRSGQHQISALDIIVASEIENIFIHKTINTIHMSGVSYTMLPYRDRRSFNVSTHDEAIDILKSKLPYELTEIDRNNLRVCIGHLALEGSIPALNEIDDTINELFCPIDMFKDYDYTFFGHIHKFQELSKNPFVAHIGSADVSNFGESGQDKFIVIIDPEKSPYHTYVRIPTRQLNQISISVPENIIDATHYVLQELKDNKQDLAKSIVKLNITLDSSDVLNVDRGIIEKYLNDLGVFHVSRINEERRVATIKKNTLDNSIDNTINETTAIMLYAEENVQQDIRDDFITLANEIVKESL
jgi:DNA repair exonuclease SbcCD nuclease subunit